MPFHFSVFFVEAEKGGPGAGEVVDQIDKAEPCIRLVQVLSKILEQISPLLGVDLRALDELLVSEQTRIRVANRVGVGPVAQSHEQGLAAQTFGRRPSIRVDEHALRRDVALGRHHAEETISNGTRVELLDESPHLAGADVDQRAAHEGVGGLPLVRFELLEPSRQALDEAHAGLEVAVAVVLETRHQLQPGELLAGAVVVPVHDSPEDPESEVLVHCSDPAANLIRPSCISSAERYSRVTVGPHWPGSPKCQQVAGSTLISSTPRANGSPSNS